jgi:hypothetical protein
VFRLKTEGLNCKRTFCTHELAVSRIIRVSLAPFWVGTINRTTPMQVAGDMSWKIEREFTE